MDPLLPLLAAVTAPVLAGKGSLLFFRAENLAPLSALQDELVTTLKDLKGCVDLIHLVKLHRTGLTKILEVRRVYKVAHLDPVDREAECLDWIGTLVGIGPTAVSRGGKADDLPGVRGGRSGGPKTLGTEGARALFQSGTRGVPTTNHAEPVERIHLGPQRTRSDSPIPANREAREIP